MTPSSENPAWLELRGKFAEAGLPLPPIPEPLLSQLRTQQNWCWSTLPIDGLDMYMFFDVMGEGRNFLLDVLRDEVGDYAAVSHAGHGINSYAINYHLVHGKLAVLMQVAWGGVYIDNAQAAQRLSEYWARIAEMLDMPAGSADDRRLLVVYSDFRDMWGCSWVTRPGTYDLASGVGAVFKRESPFDAAVRLWRNPHAAQDG